MISYFDSSVILSGLLAEREEPDVALRWEEASERLSSNLLKIECLIGIRRAALAQGLSPDDGWAKERIDLMLRSTESISFKIMDASIEDLVRRTPTLSDCRALDAIHLATALYFKNNLDEEIGIVTFDRRMAVLARKLGFSVFPVGE
jgi:predicted nucleic acid-binding protein